MPGADRPPSIGSAEQILVELHVEVLIPLGTERRALREDVAG